MIDVQQILTGVIIGAVFWLFRTTAKNESDVNSAWREIRRVKKHLNIRDENQPKSRDDSDE